MNGASMSLLHKNSKLASAVCAAVMLTFLTPGPAQAADIQITVSNLRSSSGQIIVAAFDSPRTFGKAGRDVADVKIPVTAGTVQAVLTNIPDGVYALAAYHDENGNGKMDFNRIGIPLEDYAFSNNVYGAFGSKPSFRRASIRVSEAGAAVSINMNRK